MPQAPFDFEIITPQATVFEEQVTSLTAPEMDGYFGVWAHHAPMVTRSSGGRLTVRNTQGRDQFFEIGPGFFHIYDNRVSCLTRFCTEKPSA